MHNGVKIAFFVLALTSSGIKECSMAVMFCGWQQCILILNHIDNVFIVFWAVIKL